ncbi:unnamed protein product [Staurois parvus]|uniref:Uncharacterized protein n=1 Tax=Staurois parvus TaxID=386267 RepID=A0ABN9GWR9_9NEOB|nr:unnamed protein product [Staurois parvus]
MDPFSTDGWSGIWLGRMEILRPHVVGNDPAGQSNDDPDEPPQGTGTGIPRATRMEKLLTGDTGEHS